MSSRAPRKHLQPKPESGFMSLSQVSEEFGLSKSFLYHLPETVLPRYPVGAKVLFDRSEVIAAIRGRRLSASPRTPTKTKGRGRPRKPVVATVAASTP